SNAVPPGSVQQDSLRQACFKDIGRRIMELPEFKSLDATAYAAMRTSTVFKIKVFDTRGNTVYSSEHAQIGEDKAENLGWKTAASGRPASELTHRDRFSAFEGVVENRDLISSYVPVRSAGKEDVVGVFEIYSDVTPFLDAIKGTASRVTLINNANQATVDSAALTNQQKVHSSSDDFLAIVGGLLAALYAALLVLVRNGQRIIDDQARAEEESARRQQQWHREKMTALATMAAHVSHELGNPLATISGLAEDIASQPQGTAGDKQPMQILEQTQRIAGMIRQIADFASARSEKPELSDINQLAKSVCDFLSFDSRFRSAPIHFTGDAQLPPCTVIPDYLNEVLTSVLLASVEGVPKPARIDVLTRATAAMIEIQVTRQAEDGRIVAVDPAPHADSTIASVQRRVADMNAQLGATESGYLIRLPCLTASSATSSV
ncbi:MAG: histidine kinase dimerization/phospho-acceptor domain-containing protein, partial [Usitatibacteraceae bacterium]